MTLDERRLSYRPDVDGLRALAVSIVVLAHFGVPGLAGGFVGVDIFFVLSGFLIAGLIIAQEAQGQFTYLSFYMRRARRILPALVVMLATSAALSVALLLPGDLRRFGESLSAASLGLSNILFWRQAGYFSVDAVSKPLLHTWSLGVEEQFYLLFPALLLVSLKLGRWWALVLMAVLGLLSLALCQVMLAAHANLAFYLLPTRAWELLLGVCLAMASPIPGRGWLASLAGLAGLVLVAVSVARLTPDSSFPGLAAAPAAMGTVALLWAGPQALTGRLLRLPPLVWVGKTSYSLYLWHWPVLVFGSYYALNGLSVGARVGLILGSIGLAGLSWRFIEQPIRAGQAKARFFAPLAVCLISGLVGLGAFFYLSGGLPGRFGPSVRTMLLPPPAILSCPLRPAAQKAAESVSCPLGPQDQPPRFVVWGDSHAMALASAFQTAAMRRSEPGLLIASTGCAPLLDVNWPTRPGCLAFNRSAAERALAPDVQRVFLVGRWAIHSEGTRYGDDGGTLHLRFPGVAASDNHGAFAAGLTETVTRLRWAGKEVVFVDSAPELSRSAPEALAKAMILGRRYEPDVSLSAYRDRQAFAETTARALSDRLGMTIVPTELVFCPGGECKVELNGASLYRDNHHLSPSGAAQMVDLLADALDPPVSAASFSAR